MGLSRTAKLPVLATAAAVLLGQPVVARATQVFNDDMIVTGSICAGFDCTNGESFAGTAMKFKENNLRLRLIDTTATGFPGQSWSLMANESTDGGAAYFSVALQPIDTDQATSNDPAPTHVLRTGVAGANSTAIGIGSEVVDSAVSVGNTGALRRLVHVAEALADTQAVIKRQLDEGGLAGRSGEADALEAQVTALENEVARLESELNGGDGGANQAAGGGGAMRLPGLLLLAGLAAFAARRRRPAASVPIGK